MMRERESLMPGTTNVNRKKPLKSGAGSCPFRRYWELPNAVARASGGEGSVFRSPLWATGEEIIAGSEQNGTCFALTIVGGLCQ
jgi:hypothetical protein